MADMNIHVEHLTRVEGHGDIILNAKDGTVENVMWKVTEAPRFFESFARGRTHYEMAHVTCRICGICSIGHTEASLKATEAAMGIELSRQTEIFRRLIKAAENLQSHVLHVGYLVAPDLLGVGSVFPLIETHTDAVVKIVGLHRLANEMSDLLCGRTTHPTNMIPGGFTSVPTKKQLLNLKQRLVDAVPTFNDVAEIVLANAGALPAFERKTEYVAVTRDDEYALYDGQIGCTMDSENVEKYPKEQYLDVTNEFIVPHSTAKFTKHKMDSYMVGALARFNINHKLLSPLAKEWAGKFGLKAPCYNPYMNSVAQLIECFNDVETSLAWIDEVVGILDTKNICADYEVKAGTGIGVVDVPRGILFHEYTYDDKGICTKANCIIPTNQNHNNINEDFKAIAPTLMDKPEKEVELTLEMLVRAYDPCISCSCHYLDVHWKR